VEFDGDVEAKRSTIVDVNILKDSFLQLFILRAMRFVFCVERNRKIFRKLFPPAVFHMFIDIGEIFEFTNTY
jgi:hypothetical protein